MITSISYSMDDAWQEMRELFKLDHQLKHPQVQAELNWLLAHRQYLDLFSQSKPFLYHIIQETKSRQLPGELALIPMIESTYNPFAYSPVGAAGLWQLMPATSQELGLKRDWWYDARRSVRPSTQAALQYLSQLNNHLKGDWLLAIAAYNAGIGTVLNAMKLSQRSTTPDLFWTLRLPNETKRYIPRLLALAELIQHPNKYGLQLPCIPYIPYFEEVDIGSQIDLSIAAKFANISYQELIRLNPGYNRWSTPPYAPHKILIPRQTVQSFLNNLAKTPLIKRMSWIPYQIQPGDRLEQVAKRHFTTEKLLKEINQLKDNKISAGQHILIPNPISFRSSVSLTSKPSQLKPSATVTPSFYKILHIVQENENAASIAKKHGVKEEDIYHWNKPLQKLQIGQQLTIWKSSTDFQPKT